MIVVGLFCLQFTKLIDRTICSRHCYYLSKVQKISFPVIKIITWDSPGNHKQKLGLLAQRYLYAIKILLDSATVKNALC